MRIIIIPLEHTKKEENLDVELPKVIPLGTKIFLESVNRFTEDSLDAQVLGLEDSKLLSLFEITLFLIVNQDPRLYQDIYKGTGITDDQFKNVHISQLASNAAKGTQAVLNLRKLYQVSKLSSPDYTSNNLRLMRLLNEFNIEELIENRKNTGYLEEYSSKLTELYQELISNLQEDGNYSFIDYEYIQDRLSQVSREVTLFESRASATDLKEYLKSIRDMSDCLYINKIADILDLEYSICCIGSAHVEGIRKCLTVKGHQVNVVDVIDELSDNLSDQEYSEKLYGVLGKYFE